MSKVRFEELTPPELTAAREATSLVYVSLGTLEYHGWHLPVGLDTLHAYHLCLRAAEHTGGVVLPPLYWGTRGHEGFVGSVLLEPETVSALVANVLGQLTQQGYGLIVVVSGHYPQVQGKLMAEVATEHMRRSPQSRVLVVDPFSVDPADTTLDHAGKVETSLGLYLAPEHTHCERLAQAGALEAIGADCVEGTAEYGERKLAGEVAATVRLVRQALAGL